MQLRFAASSLLVALVLSTSVFAKGKKDGLARVAILQFVNSTGSNDHAWLATSLPEVINKSMKSHFEYILTKPKKSNKVAKKVLKKSGSYTLKALSKIAKLSKSDIVIGGDFRYKQDTGRLLLRANVFDAALKQVIGTAEVTSKLDSEVFSKVDRVARKIVAQIYKIALKIDEAAAQRAVDNKDKKGRLMVMFLGWSSLREKRTAERELTFIGRQLSEQYNARFITVSEFYKMRQVSDSEQAKVAAMFKSIYSNNVIKWLKTKGVKDALLLKVTPKAVKMRPVIDGKGKPTYEYPLSASIRSKSSAIKQIARSSGMTKNIGEKNKKTQLKK